MRLSPTRACCLWSCCVVGSPCTTSLRTAPTPSCGGTSRSSGWSGRSSGSERRPQRRRCGARGATSPAAFCPSTITLRTCGRASARLVSRGCGRCGAWPPCSLPPTAPGCCCSAARRGAASRRLLGRSCSTACRGGARRSRTGGRMSPSPAATSPFRTGTRRRPAPSCSMSRRASSRRPTRPPSSAPPWRRRSRSSTSSRRPTPRWRSARCSASSAGSGQRTGAACSSSSTGQTRRTSLSPTAETRRGATSRLSSGGARRTLPIG
mmetsp:Transcript_12500/g.41060  ORF Transcript_12500/g.41060 Transcript_12500/m.41060 type:complete len:265 (+) Transcript_12500:549-1343(+)